MVDDEGEVEKGVEVEEEEEEEEEKKVTEVGLLHAPFAGS